MTTNEEELKNLCKELVDDLDAWLEYDGPPSSCIKEYNNSVYLVKHTRSFLKQL